MRQIIFLFMSLITFGNLVGQEVTQTVRGIIRDQDSRATLIGANVIVLNSDPIIGTSTDINGEFILQNVPAGRISLKITFLGYEEKVIPNLVIGGGKQVVLEVELVESLIKIDEVVVTAQKNKAEVLNEMAMLSARTFSVEETKRYAGSFNDPARMVSAYAGVTVDPGGNNDIVVRGNSSKGILWKMEGIEIPNPNHFASEGETGGAISALNSAMLSNSDFYTGAFAPEYGNAASGIFDMRLRTGNNQKREYSFSAGVIGIDATVEGPFKKGGNSSYLANYRYSSLAVLDDLGIVDFQGIPKYQDGSFKLLFPTKKAGTFSVFGLGGLSSIYQQEFDAEDENKVLGTSDYRAHMGVVGINQMLMLSNNSYLKNSISFATNGNGEDYTELEDNAQVPRFTEYLNKETYSISSTYNTKISNRHTLKAGAIYSLYAYDFNTEVYDRDIKSMKSLLEEDGQAGLMQGFINWKYRISNQFTLVSGVHYMHFLENNSNSIEPRAALKWQFTEKQSLNAGFGVNSKLEPLTVYFAQVRQADGSYLQPNKDLELAKSNHYVLGYENLLNPNLLFKAEVYYQQHFNVPVENDINSTFSVINTSGWFSDIDLVNEGEGKNYGVELTLEKYFAKNYYFLITGSIYESKYKTLENEWRNTAFNGNYATNVLFGKEFILGDPAKNRTIGVSGKVTYAGGRRFTPIDMEESIEKGYTVRIHDKAFTEQADDFFTTNAVVYYRKERTKTSHEFRLDVQNVTNHSAALDSYYNPRTKEIESINQLPLLPVFYYKIEF